MAVKSMLVTLLLAGISMVGAADAAPRSRAKPAPNVREQAQALYAEAEFARAVPLLQRALEELREDERGTALERRLREMLVLSLYETGQRDAALASYAWLKQRFSDFRFDEARVLPETIEFFTRHERRSEPA